MDWLDNLKCGFVVDNSVSDVVVYNAPIYVTTQSIPDGQNETNVIFVSVRFVPPSISHVAYFRSFPTSVNMSTSISASSNEIDFAVSQQSYDPKTSTGNIQLILKTVAIT